MRGLWQVSRGSGLFTSKGSRARGKFREQRPEAGDRARPASAHNVSRAYARQPFLAGACSPGLFSACTHTRKYQIMATEELSLRDGLPESPPASQWCLLLWTAYTFIGFAIP